MKSGKLIGKQSVIIFSEVKKAHHISFKMTDQRNRSVVMVI